MKIQYRLVTALIMASLLLMPAGLMAASQELAEKQEFRWGMHAKDINTLDPAFMTNTPTTTPGILIYNGLVRTPPGTVDLENIEGDLAESWEISNGGKTYTFKLRKGVQWHKGWGEFTAEDVKYTYDRLNDPKVGSPHRGTYNIIDQIKIIDPYTVQFDLKVPNAFFLHNQVLNYRSGNIVCKKFVEKQTGGAKMGVTAVGTGPFQFESYLSKEKIVLVRNDNYFRGKPIIERVEMFFMPKLAARTMAFVKGELDAMEGGRDTKWIKQVKKNPGIVIETIGLGSPTALYFNMSRKPLDDIRVRKALAMTMDRNALKQYFGDLWQEMPAPVPPSYLGTLPKDKIPEDCLYQPDLKKAKQLLAEAGYPNGFKLTAYSSTKRHYLANYEIAKELWKQLGVDLDVKVVDHVTFHANVRKDMNDVVFFLGPRPPVADTYLTQWYHSKAIVGTPTAITNFSHYGALDADGDGKIDNIDAIIDQARAEIDPVKQKALYHQAQLKIMKDVPAMGLHELTKVLCRRDYFDPGVPIKASMYSTYPLEKAKILKH